MTQNLTYIKINQLCLTRVAQSVMTEKPVALRFWMKLEFENVLGRLRGKPKNLDKSLSEQGQDQMIKLNPHMKPSQGIEPGSHSCEASALTTVSSLLSSTLFSKFLLFVPKASGNIILHDTLSPNSKQPLSPSQITAKLTYVYLFPEKNYPKRRKKLQHWHTSAISNPYPLYSLDHSVL